MNVIVKKTTELTESEQYGILSLFNEVFKKERTIEHFRNQFFNTVLGYSYHSILYDNDVIVGCISYIPSYYLIGNKKYLSTVVVDNMINKQYSGQGYYDDILSAGDDYMRNDGVIFNAGFPNDFAYLLNSKMNICQDIGILDIYALPYRIGGIKPALKIFNWLSIFWVNISVFLSSLFAGNDIYNFYIKKDAETYNLKRYSQPNGGYRIEQYNGCDFVYKIMNFEGIRAVFLIDVYLKSARNFNSAIRHIIKKHKKEFDILLYVGYLSFYFHGLIRVPRRFSPKIFYFTGSIIKEDAGIERNLFYDIKNWDVNLSNYDLL